MSAFTHHPMPVMIVGPPPVGKRIRLLRERIAQLTG